MERFSPDLAQQDQQPFPAYLQGMERRLMQEQLKFLHLVPSLPTRDGKATGIRPRYSFEAGSQPTYKGWKVKPGGEAGQVFRSSQPTYKGWKAAWRVAGCDHSTPFPAYLQGMERSD